MDENRTYQAEYLIRTVGSILQEGFQPYFFNPACQFSSTVNGAGAPEQQGVPLTLVQNWAAGLKK